MLERMKEVKPPVVPRIMAILTEEYEVATFIGGVVRDDNRKQVRLRSHGTERQTFCFLFPTLRGSY